MGPFLDGSTGPLPIPHHEARLREWPWRPGQPRDGSPCPEGSLHARDGGSDNVELEEAMTVGMCAAILGMTLRGAAITAPAADTGDSSATPQVATTVVPDSAGDAEKSPAPKPGLGGSVTLDNSVEGSAFYTNAYINNPAWTTNLYLRPDYYVQDRRPKSEVSALGDSLVRDVAGQGDDQHPALQLVRPPGLTFSNAKIYEEPNTHIKLNGFIRGSIPLSQASQFATLYTQLSAGVGLKKSMYGFDFGLGVQIAKNFNKLHLGSVLRAPIRSMSPSVSTDRATPSSAFRMGSAAPAIPRA